MTTKQGKINKTLQQSPDLIKGWLSYLEQQKKVGVDTRWEYLKHINAFYGWWNDKKYHYSNITDMGVVETQSITSQDIREYCDYLKTREYKSDNLVHRKQGLSEATINNHKVTLKNYFMYLLQHNYIDECIEVPKKVRVQQKCMAPSEARELFDNMRELLHFIDVEYENIATPQALKFHNKNKERNLAIIALILGTGAEIKNVIQTRISDVKHAQMVFSDNHGYNIAQFAWKYINQYLDVRQDKYGIPMNVDTMFVAKYKGEYSPIDVSSVIKMIIKYSKAYGKPITPKKLKEALNFRLLLETANVEYTSKQVGKNKMYLQRIYNHLME